MTHGCRPERSHGATGAGLALLAQLDRRLGLMARFAACLEDRRGQRFVEHTLLGQFRQRVYQIACGYEDCNDADARRVLRADRSRTDAHQAEAVLGTRCEHRREATPAAPRLRSGRHPRIILAS